MSRPLLVPARQRGAVLFIALIVLVAMSLAGIALIRGVDTANLIAGNLAFKQNTVHGGDWAVERARTWLLNEVAVNPASLYNDQQANGYWGAMQTGLDFTSTDPSAPDFDWTNNSFSLGADPAGNPDVRYVIHRLCEAAGNPVGTNCVQTTSGSGSGSTQKAGSPGLPTTAQIYYRITARVIGPRNTVSYVQVMVN